MMAKVSPDRLLHPTETACTRIAEDDAPRPAAGPSVHGRNPSRVEGGTADRAVRLDGDDLARSATGSRGCLLQPHRDRLQDAREQRARLMGRPSVFRAVALAVLAACTAQATDAPPSHL